MMGCKMPWWAGSETPPPDKDKMIADLRARVASLKEEQRNTADLLERAEDALRERDQQLAAANGLGERMRAGLVKIADVYEYTNQIPEDMTIAEWMAEQASAALSDLPEADKEKSE